ncbi:hypothetical protein GIB67_037512 [Kingdonia uniflora]|uniref:Protein kinase domain-containing protein n=1 Tax=Kingdonia uniflora TaxID=39325 RepID=A0A7J7NB31_9MAGN|nr:hypothetical protein GIB67_037512 [Kingdonia uniflora]
MGSQHARTRMNEQSYMRELARLPKEFSYQDLKVATNNFSPEEKLGSGGSGSVFKGILKDGSLVAVKRVELAEYGKQVFEAEISTIASVRHVHLVRLRGYCSYVTEMGGVFFVIYDLLPNGSLDTWIFPGTGGEAGRFLSWKLRYKVAVEVARALVYLHQDCCPHILHLDIKPENILLDEKLRAVLSDFGLSKLTNEDENEVHTKMIRGTAGYMAPEWFMGNLISDKCDIYSYGKVLLDLFFGQRYVCLDQNGEDIYIKHGNSALEQRTFHAFMWDKLTQSNLVHLIDKRLMDDGKVDELEAKSLIHVALCCLDEDPKKRPVDMRHVLRMLEAGKQNETGAMVDRFAREFSIEKAHQSGTPSGSDLLPEGNPSSADCEPLLSEATPSFVDGVTLNPEETPSDGVRLLLLFTELKIYPTWRYRRAFLLGTATIRDNLHVQVFRYRWSYRRYQYENKEQLGSVTISLSDLVEKKRIEEMYQLNYEDGTSTGGKIHIEVSNKCPHCKVFGHSDAQYPDLKREEMDNKSQEQDNGKKSVNEEQEGSNNLRDLTSKMNNKDNPHKPMGVTT